MTIDQLLEQISERGLLTTEQLTRVRASIAKSATPVTPKALAKHLVDKGMLTIAQAQSLLSAKAEQKPAAKPKPVEEDLDLAPLEELEPVDELQPLEELQELTPLEPLPQRAATPATAKQPAAKTGPAKPVTANEPASLLDELVELETMSGGPLDLLAGNASLAAEGNPLLAPVRKKGLGALFGSREPRKRKPGESEFDSPLMLFGGGALLLLLLLGGGVYFLYLRGSGDEQFKLAEEDYRAGSYTQAISKYSQYLEKFPQHPSVSLAKVHRGLARLRQATENATDYKRSLEVARTVVTEIENEKEFPEARAEFRSLLPDIAEGLAKEASKQKDAASVNAKLDETEKALAMVTNTNYIPQSQQPLQRITAIREIMALARRDLDRDAELVKAVETMKAAIDKKDIGGAYAVRKKLLKAYPDLHGNESLATTVLAVAEGEKTAITVSGEGAPAETKDLASPIINQVALAARTAEGASSGPPVAVLASGAVFGFNSGNGMLLWRRYVGFDAPQPPIKVDAGDESDVLVIDGAHHELVRLTANEGRLVWRQTIGERAEGIALLGKQAAVSTRSGKLMAVDLKTGTVLKTAVFPQGVRGIAAISPSLGRMYQVGEQATIYVLGGDLTCKQAFYLGHETGTIQVPPLMLPKHLIVVENRGAKSCTLHVLSLSNDGEIAKVAQKIDLPGHILTQPVVADRKLVLITDMGHIKVMGVNSSNLEQPLADLADQPGAGGEASMLRHLLFESGNLWIADKRLVRYKVQSAQGRLMPSALDDTYDNSAYEQPLVIVGTTLVHARRPAGSFSVLVTGSSLDAGRTIWQSQVAVSPAGEPIAADGNVIAVSALGQLFQLSAEEMKQPAVDRPATTDLEGDGPTVFTAQIDMREAGVVFAPTTGATKMLLASSKGKEDAWQARLIPLPEALACPPARLGRGIAAPARIGQVFWLNPATGKPVAAPFQPSVSAGSDVQWTTPDATADGKELIISDGPRVYRVALAREPAPHLEAAATSEELAEPIITPVAVLGSIAVAASDSGQLHVFKLPDLTMAKPIDLDGSVVWGPRRVGKHVLLTTSNDELICLDGEANIAWRQSLEYGPLAGSPALIAGELAITMLDGHVARLSLEDGKTLATADLGQPLATGPAANSKQWLVAAKDGTLLAIDPPSQEAQQ